MEEEKMKQELSAAYRHDAVEFVTVAVEYCARLERTGHAPSMDSDDEWTEDGDGRQAFADTMTKLIPLLYLKATLLPRYEVLDTGWMAEDYVTEENYNIVRANIYIIMGDCDDYLDVFVEDMKYSDTPIIATVSENLADIYQELKNFAMRYRNARDDQEALNALAEVKESFEYEWGQKAVNVLRALHEVRYGSNSEGENF